MWVYIGAVIGLFLAALIDNKLALPGLIIGGLLGYALSRNTRSAGNTRATRLPDTQTRLRLLEREVAALREEVRALREGSSTHAEIESAPSPTIKEAPMSEASLVLPAEMPTADIAAIPPPQFEPTPAPKPLPKPPAFELPAWMKKFWAGNPLAKIGIILLFFGVASGLKLAAEYGLIPLPLRLFLAAAGGIALIVFGIAKARTAERRNFGLAVQGGGFALLYLVGYFMLARYAMIGDGFAFALFAALGVGCVFLAARQDGPALAVLGISGAFLAPVLAGGHADSPLGLFSYFALLNAFILAVDWFKSWRVLNIAGFVFTFVVGMAWAVDGYRDEHFMVTQLFVVLFLAVYSAMPAATALLRAPGLAGWRDGILLFGTPLIGAFLQMQLMEGVEYGLAWSALIGSLWYFALWALMFRRPEPEIRLVERSHLGIAIALLTVSVPLAFGAQVTSAFWAAEGVATLWFGVHMRRALAQGTGLAMQLIAGVALMLGWSALGHRLPVTNDAVLGAFILTLAGLFSARLLRSLDRSSNTPLLPFVWAMLWWLGAGMGEIERFAAPDLRAPYGLLFVAASVICIDILAKRWDWKQIRAAAVLLLAAMWLAALYTLDRSGHPLAGFMALVLPAALGLHYKLLADHEKAGEPSFQIIRHLAAWWLILVMLPLELSWQANQVAPGVALWTFVAWGAVLAAGVALPAYGRTRFWPFSVQDAAYIPPGVAPPAFALALLLTWANFNLAGDTGTLHLPYLPVLNFFDATQLAGIGAALLLAQSFEAKNRNIAHAVAALLAFVWFSMLAGRIAHHWGGVNFGYYPLMNSTLFQAILTLFWTATAIATMIFASRRSLRKPWFGGFILLGVVGAKLLLFDATGRGTLTWTATLIGVALLVLAASYFAPLPPQTGRSEE